jgi:RimJ/RimL family protein N-acetyltransferase
VPYPDNIDAGSFTLRRWKPADADAYTAVWTDPSVWAALRATEDADPEATAAKSFAKQIRHWDQHGFGLWALTPEGEEAPAGWVGAWYPDFVPDVAGEIEIGWTLRSPYRGRGYATEAARHAIDATFEHTSPNRVISLIAPSNAPSAAVAARLGMRQSGEAQTELGVILRIFELPADRR